MTAEPVVFCWSGGKDSAMALHALRQDAGHEVVSLVTTVSERYDRVCIHGVRRALLERQAAALGLPLHPVWLSPEATEGEYEHRIGEALAGFRSRGIRRVAFGDIFLRDLRERRERHLAELGLTALFPIWMRDTRELVGSFLRDGFRAILSCVDTRALPEAFAGREIDGRFLDDLPRAVDPCGENGEYHSFVFDGPGFATPVPVALGEAHRHESFLFRDLVLKETA